MIVGEALRLVKERYGVATAIRSRAAAPAIDTRP